NHLVLAVDDITMPMEGYTVPAQEHVERLIDFVGLWDRAAPMVVHCYAGISRSTAGAYVAACALNPGRDEQQIAWDIRRASRTAQPNVAIVSIADRLLKRQGRMVRAIETIGLGHAAMEGDPFRLDIT
ncbi:MAG: tyrosine phosphatase family protein, partial [Hyphomicrobiales bacterium]